MRHRYEQPYAPRPEPDMPAKSKRSDDHEQRSVIENLLDENDPTTVRVYGTNEEDGTADISMGELIDVPDGGELNGAEKKKTE